MKTMRKPVILAASLLLWGLLARAQAPLAKPLADFDKLVSQLKISSVVGEPIRVGDTAVIPFAKIKFGLGGGGAMMGFGGGMGGKTVPLGILIVEADDVRAELFPEQEEKPTFLHEIIRAILDRKVVIMGNGLNVGGSSGTIQDLAPLISAMMGQTTVMGNALNLGGLAAPASAASSAKYASLGELKKLFDAKKYADALAVADALIAKEPNSADLHVWKGRIMGSLAQGNPVDRMKFGVGSMGEFEKALALDSNNPDAHIGRGIGRLAAPPGFGGDVDGAIADFEAAVAKRPSPEAYYHLGEALKNKGLNDKAAAAYKKALELQPNYPEASKALAAMK
ncbi:MAG: spore germination protein GerW family protein [Bryobacteraceae bacterium]|jgi:tetratricopeptide (TPR) repeat protein